MASTVCLNTVFNDQTVENMEFYIYNGASAVTQTFNEFTDTMGSATCGDRQYTLTLPAALPASTVTISGTTLSVSTTDMDLIGTYEVSMLVELAQHPSITDVIGITKIFTVKIDAKCIHTVFDRTTVNTTLAHVVKPTETAIVMPAFPDSVAT